MARRRIILFSGPTLHGVALSPDIEVRPPARAGNLLDAARDAQALIVLVDGELGQSMPPWHKEVLEVMAAGIPVIGAASIGALRAAELDGFGMLGVGHIYRAYRSGLLFADDELVVSHGPRELDYLPLTVAMVDIRNAVCRLRRQRRLSAASARRLIDEAKVTNFRERTWAHVAERAELEVSEIARLLQNVQALGPGLKSRDAFEALRFAHGFEEADFKRPERPQPTEFHQWLKRRVGNDESALCGSPQAKSVNNP